MITTVTLNASIDKLHKVDTLAPYEVMRVRQVSNTAGGKGLNVAKVAAQLGEKVTAMGFVGGHNGEYLTALLTPSGVIPRFSKMAGETRTCVNIWDEAAGKSTELLEPGQPVTMAEVAAFLEDFKAMLPETDIVTISGSMLPGIPQNFYAELIALARKAGKRTLLDTSGATLRESVKACPYFIKPNTDEIAQLTGQKASGIPALLEAAQSLQKQGIEVVAVSLGAEGVLVACGEGSFHGHAPKISAVNTVGCGDSMVAGFAAGFTRRLPMAETIRLAVAVSAANALAIETGGYHQGDFETIVPQILVDKMM